MKLNFKRSLIFTLILALILSCAPLAFADTVDQWVLKAPMSTPRASFQTTVLNGEIYAIGGYDGSSFFSAVETFDPKTNIWDAKASMKNPRCNFQTKVINGNIYVFGGLNKDGEINFVEEYDPIANMWVSKAPMLVCREEYGAEVIDGKIYIFGGLSTGNHLTASVEEYDPSTNKWTSKAPMSSPRYSFQTEVIDGKIYVLGGINENNTDVSTVEEYDPLTNTWAIKSPMAYPKSDFQTCVIQGKIYAVGGYDHSPNKISAVEEYDPIADKWIAESPMNDPRSTFEIEVIHDNIYAIGGKGQTDVLSSVEEYDPSANKWASKAPMSSLRYLFQTEVINGNIYAIGGKNTQYLSSVEEYAAAALTVSASPNQVKVGDQFTTTVAIHNVSNIFAEDISINYDSSLFDYVGADALPGLKIYEEDKSTPGTVRFIVAHLGTENAANGDKDLINLTFKAKAPGTGKVDITKGRIADNSTLERDVAEENCGEDSITVEGIKDVNRSGEFTLLDLGIDAGYYGIDASQTDSTRFDTDVVADGVIDDNDLTSITASLLENSNYQPNN